MTDQNEIAPIAYLDLLHFAGLAPEVFAQLNDAQRAEYERAYRASGVQPGGPERAQGRGPRASR